MGFLKPKIPTPPPAPNPATSPIDAAPFNQNQDPYTSALSLINTSAQGLKRRASTERTSLIGG